MGDKQDELAAQIVAAYVAHNAVDPDGVAKLLRDVRDVFAGDDSAARGNADALDAALSSVGDGSVGFNAPNLPLKPDALAAPKVRRKPTVEPRQSVTANFIICLECEEKFATLKRHIRSTHGMTPEQYREKHHLTPDYPMIAPAYSVRRKELSRGIWHK